MQHLVKNKKINPETLRSMTVVISNLSFEEKRACYKILRENLYNKLNQGVKPTTEKKYKEIVDYINSLIEQARENNILRYTSSQMFYDAAGEVFKISGDTAAKIYRLSLEKNKKR